MQEAQATHCAFRTKTISVPCRHLWVQHRRHWWYFLVEGVALCIGIDVRLNFLIKHVFEWFQGEFGAQRLECTLLQDGKMIKWVEMVRSCITMRSPVFDIQH